MIALSNVYVKFNFNRLHIDEALGIFKNLIKATRTKTTIQALVLVVV